METLDKVSFLEIIKYLNPQQIINLCVENNKFNAICHNDPNLWSQLLQERFPLAQRYNLDPQTEFLINARQITVYHAILPTNENDLLSQIHVFPGTANDEPSISSFELDGLRAPSGTRILLACFEGANNIQAGRRLYSVYAEPIFRKEDIIEDLNIILKTGKYEWSSTFIDILFDQIASVNPKDNKLLVSAINDLQTKNFTVINTVYGANLFYIISITLP